eukprot:gnl/TRDRNA2_/TRDRNA2_102512_c2_seq1.p1 gnl/TRDRNA2_/TRDRNA2_102512_c2~~gnl/TRDRNA2_/TRDRNA2_102512_c2_seq1.p1  ORF type:complete len:559 (-),score=120.24 gnl/TRDRNA2_/TRDRNA2_102512_c2_seq1:52-1545(-)
MSSAEVSLFVKIAASGDANVAAAVGKRYLLGIDGFRQNYKSAAHFLQLAADKDHGGAMALLGYMHCLGLGLPKSLDVAYSYFVSAAIQNDPLGHNGLGYIFFHGTSVQARDLAMAFRHFNESALGGSADGMFNLASLYLTGTGTEQSFQRATLWYTQALDRGHTPAAYTLAVMHLNGIGTVRNCWIAVDLLKRVCERGSWVSRKLQEAYDQREERPEVASWLFLKLAEAGHEVSQMNIAHLLDSGSSHFFLPGSTASNPEEEVRALGRIHAQRHYEMSAEQGNALSELRLGDYAYYGWGVTEDTGLKDEVDAEVAEAEAIAGAEEPELRLVRQKADPELSLAHYKRTAAMRITGEWMQPFVARASFNLGFMYQFGFGVLRDMPLARRYYQQCLEADPAGVQAPVSIMLVLHSVQFFVLNLPAWEVLGLALLEDIRMHLIVVHLVFLLVLGVARRSLQKGMVPSARAGASSGTDATREGGHERAVAPDAVPAGYRDMW